ncbi:MAG: hypothetical protein QOI56_173 [Actinomycetota bacterium]|nr:hypothetical protein [Actinomycetota bacterium]
MPDDEGFRRYLQAGMAWFSVTQQKAEGLLRDLADSGESAMDQAQKAFDRIVERSRQGSDELRELVRAEIREQVAALGLATSADIARLEAKIDAAQPPPSAEGQAAEGPSVEGREPASASRVPPASAPTRRKAAARTRPAPVAEGAPITKAAATRKASVVGGGDPVGPTPPDRPAGASNPVSGGEPAPGTRRAGTRAPAGDGPTSGTPAAGGGAAAKRPARGSRGSGPPGQSSVEDI